MIALNQSDVTPKSGTDHVYSAIGAIVPILPSSEAG
jgi:hypothetical protein